MKITELAVKRRITTLMLAMIIVILGSLAYSRLGLDFFPEVEFPSVSIVTIYSGASPGDIENLVTKPLEQIINSVSRVKRVTSMSSEAISLIVVEFEWGTNLDFAAQDVRDHIGFSLNVLPEDATDPLVVKFNLTQFPIIIGGITANMPLVELMKLIEDNVVPRLQRIDGVASVRIFSTDVREIGVEIDRAALESRNISQEQILLALRKENLNLPAGHIIERHSDILVRTIGTFKSLDDIRNTIIGLTQAGQPIYLKDVGDIRDSLKETRFLTRIQGGEGLVYVVNKRSGANTVTTAKRVIEELDRIQPILPSNVKFFPRMAQSDMIQRVIKSTGSNAIVGGLLAILLIIVFLRSWRPTLIIVLAIPLSAVTTFIALYAVGYTLNLLTVGGLALGIGMLVDNAVVVIENIYRHLEEGREEIQAAVKGVSEVGMAITASTLTSIIVFFPVIFTSGIAGKMVRALAVSIAFSLLASLLVAFTVVPVAATILFRKRNPQQAKSQPTRGAFSSFQKFYRRILKSALRRRYLVLSATSILILISVSLIQFLGSDFIPATDYDWLIIKVKMPTGTSLEETDRVVALAEKVIASEPGVKTVSAQAGSQGEVKPQDLAGLFSTTGPDEGLLWVGLVDQTKRHPSSADILENIRQKLPQLDNVKFEALDISQVMTIGTQAPIDIKVFGKDLNLLKETADDIVEHIRDVEGLRDVSHSMVESRQEYHIKIEREKAYRMGLMVSQVAAIVRTAAQGAVATRYKEGNEEVDIRIRYKKKFRDSLETLQNIPIMTPYKQMVRLFQVASITQGAGPIQITRENQERKISIFGNIQGRDLGRIIGDIKKRISRIENNLPSGYFVEYGGQYKEMRETFLIMAAAFALATLLVFMVMASQFESFLHPIVIMFTIPLSLIGVITALLATRKPISLPVMIGFVILAGIAVNNGIVMVDYINQLKRKGVEKKEAILQACSVRLRPVLITALTTIFGMAPMALSTSAGAEIRSSMAVTVVGGLTATTFLTLFVIPIIYSLFDRVKFQEE